MKEFLVTIRNKVFGFVYQKLLKPIYFKMDPERVHDRMCELGAFLGKHNLTRRVVEFKLGYENKALKQEIKGIKFANPVGLAAGFDKNACLTDILPSVGFGFMEVGSITAEPCEGNKKPRLWRLKKSKSIVVYYGLKNQGAIKIADRLKNQRFKIPVGINIAKTNSQNTIETSPGIADYIKTARQFVAIGDYFTINISCPNAYGGLTFTDAKKLDLLLTEFDEIETIKPIFLKLSPDLSDQEIDQIIDVVKGHRVHGFVVTNLTKNKDNEKIVEKDFPEKGGVSGKPVYHLSLQLIKKIYQKTNGRYVIIGLGGVFNADDAYKMIKAGASLVQLITGMIFQGPQVISEINQGLVKRIKKDGLRNISEAVGLDYKN